MDGLVGLREARYAKRKEKSVSYEEKSTYLHVYKQMLISSRV